MAARIVFDLDGTLIDSAADIQFVANVVLESRAIEPLSLNETRSFIGEGTPRLIEQIRQARSIDDHDQDPMLKEFMEIYPTAVSRTTTFDGVEAALKELLAKNHSLGICTNKPYGPTIAIFDHLNLSHYFEVIVGGDTYPKRKPDPLPLVSAMGELTGETQIYVGDSITDAKAAESASIPFVLYMHGYTNSDSQKLTCHAQFEDFSDLCGIVNSLVTQ